MSYHNTSSPWQIIAERFYVPERHIVIAETALLSALPLNKLAHCLGKAGLHPDFEQDAKLRLEYEHGNIEPSRFAGPLEWAIGDMCVRNLVKTSDVVEILQTGGVLAPLMFASPFDGGRMMLTHEVTIYSSPTK